MDGMGWQGDAIKVYTCVPINMMTVIIQGLNDLGDDNKMAKLMFALV